MSARLPRALTRHAALLGALTLLAAGCALSLSPSSSNTESRILSECPDRLVVQLDNGLVVIAQEIPTAPVVSVHCWVKTGSVFEQEHNGKGLSHFLEHLVSGGATAARTETQHNEILGRIGASTNAATSLDTVRYYINTDSAHAEAAVELMSDWMQHSLITPEAYERERDVIQREFQMGAGEPDRIFWKATQLARYRNHPARHPIIGYLDEFLAVSRDEIYDFYKRMYVPNNMVFVVAGKIDRQAVVKQISRLWQDAEPGALPTIELPAESDIEQPRQRVVRADIDRPRLRILWPGTKLRARHDYALDLLGQVLGQGELSRLVRTVRDEKRLVTSIDAFNYSTTWGKGFFGVDATLNVRGDDKTIAVHAQKTTQLILAEIDRLIREGVRADELARAKRKTISTAVLSAQTAHATAGRLASDFIATGNPDYLNDYAQAVQSVTGGQVVAAAEAFLQPKRQITVQLLPQEKKTPPDLKRPADEPADAPTGKVERIELDNARLVRQLEALQASDETARPAEVGPVTLFRLSNGLRVIHQRTRRLPIVAMQWYQLGGLLADEPGREGVANAAASLMMKGAAGQSAEDIARRLESLGASLNTHCGNSTTYASGQCLSGDWNEVFGLLAAVVTEPDFPAAEWSKMKPRLLAAIDSQDDDWYSQLRNTFRNTYFGDGHPWASPIVGRRPVVEKLTADDLKRFHQAHLSANDAVLAVFGDVEAEAVKAQAEKLFAELPAKAAAPFQTPTPPRIEPRVKQVVIEKPMAAVQIGYAPGMKRNNPDYAPMLVMNRVLSSFPVGWLDQALRGEGPGLVYAVGSGLSTGAAQGYWALLFNTKPETVVEASSRALNVVRRIHDEPVEADTLERARTKVLVGESLGQQSNAQRATQAALNELYGIGYDHSDQFIEQIRRVTAQDVHRVAQKYLAKPLAVILTQQKVEAEELQPLGLESQ